MAYLYAGKDKVKSETYLDAYLSEFNPPGIDFFQALLKFRHESKQQDPDIAKILEVLNTIYNNTDEALFLLAKMKIELSEIASSKNKEIDLTQMQYELEKTKKKNTHHESLNETLELVLIVVTYFNDNNEAQQLLTNCVYCENYNTEFLGEAMKDENDLLVVYFIDKLDAVEEYYNWFEVQFLRQLLENS